MNLSDIDHVVNPKSSSGLSLGQVMIRVTLLFRVMSQVLYFVFYVRSIDQGESTIGMNFPR